MWYKSYAGVLELVDEVDSKSVASDGVWVRVPPPAPQRCVIVDTNGYAPLFFSIEKALKYKGFWQQGVQMSLLAARTFLCSDENHIFL